MEYSEDLSFELARNSPAASQRRFSISVWLPGIGCDGMSQLQIWHTIGAQRPRASNPSPDHSPSKVLPIINFC